MSIILFSGLPGSGKSYGVVENVIIPACKAHRDVYTNIPLKSELILQDFQHQINQFDNDDPKDPEFLKSIPPGSVIVIDEAWRYWPSGLRQDKIPESTQEFFTEHRHNVSPVTGLTNEIVLLTQDANFLCSFVRILTETTYISKKLSAIGLNKRYTVDIHEGCVTRDNLTKKPLRQIQGSYKKEIYKYYVSHTKNKSSLVANEKQVDTRNNLLKSPKVWLALSVSLVCLITSALVLPGLWDDMAKPPGQPKSEEQIQQQKLPQPTSSSTNTQQPHLNDSFLSEYDVTLTSWYEDNSIPIFTLDLKDGDVIYSIKSTQLKKLGYSVTVLDFCLVKISGIDFSEVLPCLNHKKTDSQKEETSIL